MRIGPGIFQRREARLLSNVGRGRGRPLTLAECRSRSINEGPLGMSIHPSTGRCFDAASFADGTQMNVPPARAGTR